MKEKIISRNLQKAFTLVELVVVIAIIAILSAVSVGAYFGITNSAKESVALQEGTEVKTTLIMATTPKFDSKDTAETSDQISEKDWSVTYIVGGLEFASVEGLTWNESNIKAALQFMYKNVQDKDIAATALSVAAKDYSGNSVPTGAAKATLKSFTYASTNGISKNISLID